MEVNSARFISIPNLGRIPVGKLVCIGRNYSEHAAEMKHPVPDVPMVFLKPTTALLPHGGIVQFPTHIGEVHHEVELVAVVGHRVRNATPREAQGAVVAYAVGLDMTARALQSAAKRAGAPWSEAKGFDTFAPIGMPVNANDVDLAAATITLRVNGNLVQEGRTADMIFGIADLIVHCSAVFTLEPGDLIYTGTPSGVGPVKDGDALCAEITGLPDLRVTIATS